MTARLLPRRIAAGALCALVTVAATSPFEHGAGDRDLDVTVVSVATPAEPSATDEAVVVDRLHGRSSTVQSSSTATSDCDGCSATASAVTVTYVNGSGSARVDNVAHTWSSACRDCTSSGVSVQVVVLRRAGTVHATNRAFAANAACEGCTSSAAAYQLVVLAPGGRAFDRRTLAELTEWARAQAAQAIGGPAARSVAPDESAGDRLAELEEQTADALGGVTTLHRDVDVSAG